MKKTALALTALLALSACGGSPQSSHDAHNSQQAGSPASSTPAAGSTASASSSAMDHSAHHHGGSLPAGITIEPSPTFAKGQAVVIHTDHMPGMDAAKGTVAGAFKTTTYAVDYTPTDGGPAVKDHKWVVHEEIKDAATTPYTKGQQVVLEADHMPGMKGAKATIAQVTSQTVYTVNYTPTDGSPMVMDHMWVTEDELSKA